MVGQAHCSEAAEPSLPERPMGAELVTDAATQPAGVWGIAAVGHGSPGADQMV